MPSSIAPSYIGQRNSIESSARRCAYFTHSRRAKLEHSVLTWHQLFDVPDHINASFLQWAFRRRHEKYLRIFYRPWRFSICIELIFLRNRETSQSLLNSPIKEVNSRELTPPLSRRMVLIYCPTSGCGRGGGMVFGWLECVPSQLRPYTPRHGCRYSRAIQRIFSPPSLESLPVPARPFCPEIVHKVHSPRVLEDISEWIDFLITFRCFPITGGIIMMRTFESSGICPVRFA